MNEPYFKNLTHIENLWFEFVLLEYDNIPTLFLCSDKHHNLYLCFESESTISHLKWIITPIDIEILIVLINKEISIATIYKNADYIIKVNMDSNYIETSQYIASGEINPLDLSVDDVYWWGETQLVFDFLNKFFDDVNKNSAAKS